MDDLIKRDSPGTETGSIDRSDRRRVEVSGPDRAKFLHNLTTNEVKRLAAGRGCEAFVTSPQGKTIGYVAILVDDDRILVRSDPVGMDLVLPHFRKYGLFDDVAIEDRSQATFELHLVGPLSDELVRIAAGRIPGEQDYAHEAADIAGRPVRVVRESPAGRPGLTLIGERADADAIIQSLKAADREQVLAELEPAVFEALRIEAGTPVFGKDVTEKNLPQEIARDDRAISFVKGCYLGQETVARIDALGHVNQVLKGLEFEPAADLPHPGSTLEADGKRVGTITSSAISPRRGSPIALGLIRTSHAAAGTRLQVTPTEGATPIVATVCDLHFPSRP
jgi:folate-binding protein YgfZ